MTEVVAEEVGPNGAKAWSAKCSRCQRVETSTPEENKTRFARSLIYAGWKWKKGDGGRWVCVRCEVGY